MCTMLQAGAGVFFDSAAGSSSMSVVGNTITNNFVDFAVVGNSHDGLGGANTAFYSHMRRRGTRVHSGSKSVMTFMQLGVCAGGVFLNHYNFLLQNSTLSGNSAYYGAGLFVGTDVTANASLTSLAFSNNVGKLGAARADIQAVQISIGNMQYEASLTRCATCLVRGQSQAHPFTGCTARAR